MDHILIEITMIGGNCPVQAEGTVNGHPFYFRARHTQASLSIAGPSQDVFGKDAWTYTQECEDAGWLEEAQALDLIKSYAHRWFTTQK